MPIHSLEHRSTSALALRRSLAIFGAPVSPTGDSTYLPWIEKAALVSGLRIVPTRFHEPGDDLVRAIDTLGAGPDGGLIILPSGATASAANRELVRGLATKHRLPAIHWDKPYPKEGGLMSYGSDFTDLHRRAASYVDRILSGAKINELPVQVPTKFDLVVNTGAAKSSV
jgi:putative ABC transport system substrate-binding protein